MKEELLWTEKYQPQNSSDVIGNTASVRKLHGSVDGLRCICLLLPTTALPLTALSVCSTSACTSSYTSVYNCVTEAQSTDKLCQW